MAALPFAPGAIREAKTAPGDVAAYDLRAKTPGQTDIPRLRAGTSSRARSASCGRTTRSVPVT